MPKLETPIELKPTYPVAIVDLTDETVISFCQRFQKRQERIGQLILNQNGINSSALQIDPRTQLVDYLWLLGAFIHYHVTTGTPGKLEIMLAPDTMRDPTTEQILGLF